MKKKICKRILKECPKCPADAHPIIKARYARYQELMHEMNVGNPTKDSKYFARPGYEIETTEAHRAVVLLNHLEEKQEEIRKGRGVMETAQGWEARRRSLILHIQQLANKARSSIIAAEA